MCAGYTCACAIRCLIARKIGPMYLNDQGRHAAPSTVVFDQRALSRHFSMCFTGVYTAGNATVFGWEGWRFVFLSVAAVSVLIGALNYFQAQDPNYTPDGSAKLNGASVLSLKEIWREMKVVMSVPTFLLIIMQVTSVSGSWLFCCICA